MLLSRLSWRCHLNITSLFARSSRPTARSFSKCVTLSVEMETVNTTERLKHLRDLMKKNKVDIYSRHKQNVLLFQCTLSHCTVKLYHPKTVINRNMLQRVMLAEVGLLCRNFLNRYSQIQHTLAGFLAQQVPLWSP